jgi:hypothetical protein
MFHPPMGPQPITARLSISDGAGLRPRALPMLKDAHPPHNAARAPIPMNSFLFMLYNPLIR